MIVLVILMILFLITSYARNKFITNQVVNRFQNFSHTIKNNTQQALGIGNTELTSPPL